MESKDSMKARDRYKEYQTLKKAHNKNNLHIYARMNHVSLCCLYSRLRSIEQLKERHGEDIFELLE
jgi:hypothetical protein